MEYHLAPLPLALAGESFPRWRAKRIPPLRSGNFSAPLWQWHPMGSVMGAPECPWMKNSLSLVPLFLLGRYSGASGFVPQSSKMLVVIAICAISK